MKTPLPTFLDIVIVFIVFGGVLILLAGEKEWGEPLALGFLGSAILVILINNAKTLDTWQQNTLGALTQKEGKPS